MCKQLVCVSSPDGCFEFEELLRGLDHPGVVAGQDAGAQEEAHIPVALQFVQAALLPQQAAQLHPWRAGERDRNRSKLHRGELQLVERGRARV